MRLDLKSAQIPKRKCSEILFGEGSRSHLTSLTDRHFHKGRIGDDPIVRHQIRVEQSRYAEVDSEKAS
ncbi:hypothetical protein Y032_0028g1807 [Ancylostoma ceylanicum]|uniref:Uncharacterized protein n=1 Tax=Ancylostoma ceylanicum TaxID=53326 RepID=A0A016UU49_9BILA|nr:hypothetical protein Y032_0028g1807 [Ancylostoma ceylanicum]